MKRNIDKKVVKDFGDEWTKYDQTKYPEEESRQEFNRYFNIFPLEDLTKGKTGADFGCGTGRWAKHIAPKVGKLYCIDPSLAIEAAKKNLNGLDNIVYEKASISNNSIEEGSLDFAYCLGVIHHIPDPKEALNDCVAKLKKGCPILIYVYYSLDNQPKFYKWVWNFSDILRKIICRFPSNIKILITNALAFFIYLPLSRTALILEKLNIPIHQWPLSHYRNKSFYSMKTDSLDRFGTSLEYRFSKQEITGMMRDCGLTNISFYDGPPYWCAIGFKN